MGIPKVLIPIIGSKPLHLAVTIYSSTGYNECGDDKGFWTTDKKAITCKKCLAKMERKSKKKLVTKKVRRKR
jgi:hypothetical protein